MLEQASLIGWICYGVRRLTRCPARTDPDGANRSAAGREEPAAWEVCNPMLGGGHSSTVAHISPAVSFHLGRRVLRARPGPHARWSRSLLQARHFYLPRHRIG